MGGRSPPGAWVRYVVVDANRLAGQGHQDDQRQRHGEGELDRVRCERQHNRFLETVPESGQGQHGGGFVGSRALLARFFIDESQNQIHVNNRQRERPIAEMASYQAFV